MMIAVLIRHKAGIVHCSICSKSFMLSFMGQDKLKATSPYAIMTSRLRIILLDWGLNTLMLDAAKESTLGVHWCTFGIPGVDSYKDQDASNDWIAIAAMNFV
jgi:hypothetical protein